MKTLRKFWNVVTPLSNDWTEICKRCKFNVGGCGYDDGRFGEIASLHKGDRVQVVSVKSRSASGTEIYEVKFQSWVGWMDAADLTLDTE